MRGEAGERSGEERGRVGRPSRVDQQLADELGRRLDWLGQPEGRRQLPLGFGRGLQDRERFVVLGGE